jgi:hypothetical protein
MCLAMYAQTNVGLLCYISSGSNVAAALAVDFHEIFQSVQFWYSSITIYCAKNQKVAGSIPGGVMEFFVDINPSDRTMALGSTQPLTEMSTRSISWG